MESLLLWIAGISFLLAVAFSGVLTSGDRVRANYHTEHPADRSFSVDGYDCMPRRSGNSSGTCVGGITTESSGMRVTMDRETTECRFHGQIPKTHLLPPFLLCWPG